MKQRFLACTFLLAGWFLLAGCEPDDIHVNIDETLIPGLWRAQDNMQEYWRFDAAHTGETWDESDDVHEGEGTNFNWSAVGDQLRIDLYGMMGQHAYYDYTVVRQTRDTLVWKDLFGNQRTFVKR